MIGNASARRLLASAATLATLATACAGDRATVERQEVAAPAVRSRAPAARAAATPEIAPSAHASYGAEPTAAATALEVEVAEAVRPRLATGSRKPTVSPALTLAARELALRAAHGDAEPLDRAKVRAALARGLAYDPAPVAHLVVAPVRRAATALARTVPPSPATHVGVGAVERDGTAWVVLLAAERSVALRPFPREIAPGHTARLQGELIGLEGPRVHVTQASGEVREVPVAGARRFSADVEFPAAGRYLVEVTGRGRNGPEVAALLAVSCGGASLAERERRTPAEPVDPAAAEARVLEAINALRKAHGRAPLEPDAAISAVARRHSADMLARGVLGHELPGAGDLRDRLRRAGVAYRRAFENVARGVTAQTAHDAAEESPAHRDNMLSREVSRVGCGIARGRLPGGDPVVYLTEIFVQPSGATSDSAFTPEAQVKDALWRERARLGRASLLSDARLDDLARESARAMLRSGQPDTDLASRALSLGRDLSAADAFVVVSPGEAVRSANLADARMKRVGVGVATGDHPRYGAGMLWIAIVYTD